MIAKILSFQKDAREKLALGAQKLASAVISTLGPLSRNVAIDRGDYEAPVIIHDGVKVAREVYLRDPLENMGAQLLKEAAVKTNDLVGDGTTTATLLANSLFQKGLKLVEGGVVDGVIAGRVNPMMMRSELALYTSVICSELDKMAISLKNKEQYQAVASISSGSSEIGRLVASAIEKVGKDGVVMVEESPYFESSLEISDGMEFENGWLSGYFVTDADRMVCEYSDGYVLLTDYQIADPMSLVPIVEEVIKDGNKPLLIIASDVVGAALQALVATKLRLQAKLVAVIAPEYAERRKEMLRDISVLTGGDVISSDLGQKLAEVKIGNLGRFRNLKVTQTHTTLTPLSPDSEEINERVLAIKEQIQNEENAFKKERLEYRLAKLSSSAAVIKIGGGGASEIKDKWERCTDAIFAVKAALAEGVIPGGGVALKNIADSLENNTLKPDRLSNSVARELVINTLYAPFETILKNSGIENIDEYKDFATGRGLDVTTKQSVDMVEAGIVDPVKVTKLAVKHAFSVASMMLTTDTLISFERKEEKQV